MEENNSKIEKDRQKLSKAMLREVTVGCGFVIMSLIVICLLFIEYLKGAKEALILIPGFMIFFFIGMYSLTASKQVRIFLALKQDLIEKNTIDTKLNKISKVSFLYTARVNGRDRTPIGLIFHNFENYQIKRYYYILEDEVIDSKNNFDKIKEMDLNISYYENSKYIVSLSNEEDILHLLKNKSSDILNEK